MEKGLPKLIEMIDGDYPVTPHQGLIHVGLSGAYVIDLLCFRGDGLVWIGLPTRGCDCFAVKTISDVVTFSEVQEKLHVQSEEDARNLARFITVQCQCAFLAAKIENEHRAESAQKKVKIEKE